MDEWLDGSEGIGRLRPVPPRRSLAAPIALGCAALLIFGVQPALLSGLVTDGRVSEAAAGMIVTAELLSMACGSALGPALLRLTSARPLIFAACLLLALGNAMTAVPDGLWLIMAARAICGLVEGLIVAVPATAIANAEQPERASALFLIAQALSQIAAVALLPGARFGGTAADGAVFVMGATAIAVAAAAWMLPAALRPAPPRAGGERLGGTSLAGLTASAGYLGAIIVVWSYFGIWLQAAPATAALESYALGISLAFQLAGATAAAAIGGKISNRKIILGAAAGEILLIVFLVMAPGQPNAALIFSALFGFLWQFGSPAFVGLLIEIDPSRRAALFIPPAQLLGAAMLPLLAAAIVGRFGVSGAMLFAAAVLAAGCLVVAATRSARTGGATAEPG